MDQSPNRDRRQDRSRNEDLGRGIRDEDIAGRAGEGDEDEFDDTENLEEEEEEDEYESDR